MHTWSRSERHTSRSAPYSEPARIIHDARGSVSGPGATGMTYPAQPRHDTNATIDVASELFARLIFDYSCIPPAPSLPLSSEEMTQRRAARILKRIPAIGGCHVPRSDHASRTRAYAGCRLRPTAVHVRRTTGCQ